MIYDCAVIGTGPAGLAAALNLKIHHRNFVWIGSKSLSDKITKAEKISNYPGLPAVSGQELAAAFQRQIELEGLSIEEHMVNSIMSFGSHYALMAGSEFYEAKTVILATGVAVTAAVAGEQELLGRGVSYCATCDGNLYRGKKIAVICNSARFEHEVRFLAGLAAEVKLFALYKNPGQFPENTTLYQDAVKEILGDRKVSGIRTGRNGNLEVDGVFCLRDSIALASLLPGLETEEGHIRVNRSMETSLPGVYAAGDCTGRPYQYTKSVGEGNVASLSAVEYLDSLHAEG